MATECKFCGTAKNLIPLKIGGKAGYFRGRCRDCENRRLREERSELRKQNRRQDRWIREDSKKSDRKKGFENDLTREFIAEQIEHGCSYCGATDLRMTLDRIDNNRGHTQDNVVPACIRCNYTRGNMPYGAWLILSPAMREARKKGLFEGWSGRAR